MPAPAFRCCRSPPDRTRRGCKSCSIRSCWSRWRSHPGHSAISMRPMASSRWSSAPACWRSRLTSTASAKAVKRRAPHVSFSRSRSFICLRCLRPFWSRSLAAPSQRRSGKGAWQHSWPTTTDQRESSSPRRKRKAVVSGRSPSRSRSALWFCCSSRSPSSRGRPCSCGRCREMANHQNQHRASAGEKASSRRGLTRDAAVAAICGFVVVFMLGAAYAAVPFYNWFCRATGFNGTTQVATSAPSAVPLARKIAVRFDSNVAGGLPWKFEPEQTEIEIRIGEVVTVYYNVTNQSARTTTGQAAYNVAPLTVGSYFEKINCFCFTEQTMAPGETRQMPVVFYVDPSIVKDSENDSLNTITLSYTFFPVREPTVKPLAAGEAEKSATSAKGNL